MSISWLHGRWHESLIDADICVKKLAAVVIAVCAWGNRFAHRRVLVRLDIAAVVAWINARFDAGCTASTSAALFLLSPTVMRYLGSKIPPALFMSNNCWLALVAFARVKTFG